MPDTDKQIQDDAVKTHEKHLEEFLAYYEGNMDSLRSKKYYEQHLRIFRMALHGIGILNYWDPEVSGEAHFLRTWLAGKQRPLVLDVGALKGGYARLVRDAAPDAEVHSFEPHPKSFMELQKTAGELGTNAHPFGMSDVCGSSMLYDYEDSRKPQHSSLYRDVIERIHLGKSTGFEVRLETLDGFLAKHELEKVSLLKIDAEGHELPILCGALQTIENGLIDAVHFEFNEMNVYSRTFFKDIYEILNGYSFYRMLPDGLAPLGNYRNPLLFELFAYQNIVALREPERA